MTQDVKNQAGAPNTTPEDFEALAGTKVQLDIDDAPFLKEEPPPAPPQPVKETAVAPQAAPPPKKSKKKLIIAGALAGVLLLGGGAGAYIFLFSGPPPPPPPKPPVIVVPSEQAEAPKNPVFTITTLPFVLELKDETGQRRFLTASFALITENVLIYHEIDEKMMTIRDAMYYYMRTQSYNFLNLPSNSEQMRADMLEAINSKLLNGKLESLYFNTFVIR